MVTVGAVLAGAEPETFTTKVAGAKSKVPPVLLDVCVTVMVAEPTACGVTVRVFMSPHDVKVADVGLTVATVGVSDEMLTPSVVLPVKLQPLLPSRGVPLLPVGFTYNVVVPFGPPTLRGMISAVESIVVSKLLLMSSAKASPAPPATTAATTPANPTAFVHFERTLIAPPRYLSPGPPEPPATKLTTRRASMTLSLVPPPADRRSNS
jgi:hypothetical protein